MGAPLPAPTTFPGRSLQGLLSRAPPGVDPFSYGAEIVAGVLSVDVDVAGQLRFTVLVALFSVALLLCVAGLLIRWRRRNLRFLCRLPAGRGRGSYVAPHPACAFLVALVVCSSTGIVACWLGRLGHDGGQFPRVLLTFMICSVFVYGALWTQACWLVFAVPGFLGTLEPGNAARPTLWLSSAKPHPLALHRLSPALLTTLELAVPFLIVAAVFGVAIGMAVTIEVLGRAQQHAVVVGLEAAAAAGSLDSAGENAIGTALELMGEHFNFGRKLAWIAFSVIAGFDGLAILLHARFASVVVRVLGAQKTALLSAIHTLEAMTSDDVPFKGYTPARGKSFLELDDSKPRAEAEDLERLRSQLRRTIGMRRHVAVLLSGAIVAGAINVANSVWFVRTLDRAQILLSVEVTAWVWATECLACATFLLYVGVVEPPDQACRDELRDAAVEDEEVLGPGSRRAHINRLDLVSSPRTSSMSDLPSRTSKSSIASRPDFLLVEPLSSFGRAPSSYGEVETLRPTRPPLPPGWSDRQGLRS